MKTLKFLLPSLMLFLAVSCSKDDDNVVTAEQQGGISNVVMVSESVGTTPVKISAVAIGNNGCWSNMRLELEKVSTYKYNLRSYGTVTSGGMCTEALVQVNSETSFTPTAQGTYEITVYNSPTQSQVKTVNVLFTR